MWCSFVAPWSSRLVSPEVRTCFTSSSCLVPLSWISGRRLLADWWEPQDMSNICLHSTWTCFLFDLGSTQILWQTCWTSGGCSERDSSENPAFFTEGTMLKTSADWDENSATSSLLTIHLPLTFSTQKTLWVFCLCNSVSGRFNRMVIMFREQDRFITNLIHHHFSRKKKCKKSAFFVKFVKWWQTKCHDKLFPRSESDSWSPQVPVQSWFDDMNDTELLDLLPFFEGLSKEEEVYGVLQNLRSR